MAGFAGPEVGAQLVKALRASLGQGAVIMTIDPLGPVPDAAQARRAGRATVST